MDEGFFDKNNSNGTAQQPSPEQLDVWLEQAKRGLEAFDALYDYYFPKIYAYIFYKVGNQTQAEDMTSEVFVRVVSGLEAFHGDHQAFTAWIYRIASNLVTDYYRLSKRKVQICYTDPEKLAYIAEKREVGAEIDDHIDRESLLERVRDAVLMLKPADQELVVLKFFEGLDNQTIAKIMSLKVGTINVRIHRVVEKIRRLFPYKKWEEVA